jgi:two-component system sensor histidine kinase PilS (NtrC family)
MSDTLYKIRLLMVVRVVAVTTLLIVAFLVELWFHPARSLRPLYILTAATYVLTILYALLDSTLRRRSSNIYVQLTGDVLTCSGFVYITGGVTSPFSFLYVPVIIAGAMLLYRRGATAAAILSCSAYALLVILILAGLLPSYPPDSFHASATEVKRASFSLLVHLLGFGLVGVLSSALSENLRRTGEELGETRENLEDLQVFNALIIDSVNSGLVTSDGLGRITFLNRSAREITGLPEGATLGRTIQEIFGLPGGFLERLRDALHRERRYRFETAFEVSDEVTRNLGFTAGVLRDKNQLPLGYIYTFQDLTEIKSLEKEVLLRERMAAVGEMAAGMAHELRNPLASLSGSAQVLKAALPGGEGDRQDLLAIIQRESLRLDQVLKDFLDFARPRPFEPEPMDLVPLLDELVQLLRNSPGIHPGHEVVTSFESDSLPCNLDINRIKQVFWNLASNALRAMPDGGRLIIHAGHDQPGTVSFSFVDSGRGMTPEEVKDFFRPFRSGFDGGTGLGAAIVYRIVEEHQGRVNVQSEPGRGTRVTITMPQAPSDQWHPAQEDPWRKATERAS